MEGRERKGTGEVDKGKGLLLRGTEGRREGIEWEGRQRRRVHRARPCLVSAFNPPVGAMSGLVQFLEQCFTSCFRKYTSIILFTLH